MAKKPPAQDLTVYLLKVDDRPVEEFVPKRNQLKKFLIGANAGIGTLFVKTPKGHIPRWAKFFAEFVDATDLGKVASSSAILLVKTHGRVFALTFGQGRYLLEADCWEERFGLRVALNSIKEDRLRSVDKVTFDAISTHTRTQSSQEASAPQFGLDVEQDLVRAVTGIPSDETIGRRMTGMDALHVSASILVDDLRPLLGRYKEQFEATYYRQSFPWIDHIAEVTSKKVIAELDEAACAQINGAADRCWLAVPEIIDWTRVTGFRYGFGANTPETPDIRLSEFKEGLDEGQQVTPLLLSTRRVFAIDGDGNKANDWSLYKCLYCEVVKGNQTFVLSGGKWYRIDTDFAAAVKKSFDTVERVDLKVQNYAHSSEGDYCVAVADKPGSLYALMDKKTIQIGGGRGKIEFCDLFSTSKELVHIKRYGASSVLSHLFSQGVVSAEAFRSEPEFRKSALALLPKPFHWQGDPDISAFKIIFAVVSEKTGQLELPFFSKVNLRHAVRRLEAFGYKVALAKIGVDDAFAKKKKY